MARINPDLTGQIMGAVEGEQAWITPVSAILDLVNGNLDQSNISVTLASGTGTVTTVKDEGVTLSAAVTDINFVGAGVTATGTTSVTVTIPGGGTVPTGTGFTHITAGAQDAAAKLVDTADINASQVTYPKIQNVSASNRLLGRSTAAAGVVEEITVGGDISQSGSTFTVANSAITLPKMADIITTGLIYRKTAGTGAPEVNTLATLKNDLGLTGTNSGDQTITLTGGVTGSGTGSFAATVVTNANLTGPVTSAGNATAIANSVNLPASPTTTTQTPADNSTKIATTAYVDNAVLGQNYKEAAKYATTAALVAIVYSNGASGVGATLTEVSFGALSVDGVTPSVGDRILVKNQASTFQNGIYTVTTVGSVAVLFVLTRATDADQTNEYKTGDSVFVTAGNTLTSTTWAYTGIDNPTMGTTALTFVQAAGPGIYSQGNGITITGTSIAIDTSVTVDKTTAQVLTNKDLTAGTNTFPTFNQNTTGSAAKLTTGRTLALTGDVTYTSPSFDGSANVTAAATIAAAAVTLAKMENRAPQTFIGRNTAGSGVPEELSIATAKTMLSLTGTNSGDQTITLTGHVTGSGTGSFATSTASKMILQGTADATTSAAQFLGALGTGIVKNTTTTGVLSIAVNSDLPVMSATVGGAVPTPPNNTTTFLRGDGTFAAPVGGGDMVLASAQTNSGVKTFLDTTMALRNVANTFSGVFINTVTAARVWTLKDATGTLAFTSDITGTNSGTNTGDQTITLTGDVTGSGTGSFAATIAANAVTLAKMATVNSQVILGRTTAATGNVEALTATQTRSVLVLGTTDIVQFGKIGIGQANVGAAYYEAKTLTAVGTQGMRLEADNVGNVQFSSFLTGDAQLRFAFLADGTQKWGSGAAVADTNLYRSAVSTLKTDNTLVIGTPGTVAGSAETIDGTQTVTNKTITGTTNNVSAKSLLSATTTIDVFAATAPITGQVLTATSNTAATWQTVTAVAPDIALSILAPAVDETITAGYSAVLVRKYKIASGKKLTIGLGSRFRIL